MKAGTPDVGSTGERTTRSNLSQSLQHGSGATEWPRPRCHEGRCRGDKIVCSHIVCLTGHDDGLPWVSVLHPRAFAAVCVVEVTVGGGKATETDAPALSLRIKEDPHARLLVTGESGR